MGKKIVNKLCYVLLAFSLLGTSVISISIGSFMLTPFRILLIINFIIIFIYFKRKINFNKNNRFLILFPFIWIAYALISLLWAINIKMGFSEIYFISILPITLIIFLLSIDVEFDFYKILNIFMIIGLVHIFIGFFEVFTGVYMFLEDSSKLQNYIKNNFSVSIFYNINNFSFYLFFLFMVSIITYRKNTSKIIKILSVISIMGSLVLMVNNQSRAVLISLIISVMTILFLLLYSKKKYKILIAIVFSSIIILMLILHKYISISNNASDSIRFDLIKSGLNTLTDTYFLGSGVGNLSYYIGNIDVDGILSIHNWWIEILSTFGIIIFILYILFYMKMLHLNYQLYIKTKDVVNLIYFSMMIGFSLIVVGPSTIMKEEWFWVFSSLIIVHTIYMSSKKEGIGLKYK